MRIGETLADFSAMGYRLTPAQTDSTKLTFENIKLSDYLTKSCSCLAITIGARWCGACQQEQPALKTVVSQHSDLCVLGVLQESNTNGSPAQKSDVDAWTTQFKQNFSVIQGTPTTDDLLFANPQSSGSVGLPVTVIVKPSTMKVLLEIEGYDTAVYADAMAACQ